MTLQDVTDPLGPLHHGANGDKVLAAAEDLLAPCYELADGVGDVDQTLDSIEVPGGLLLHPQIDGLGRSTEDGDLPVKFVDVTVCKKVLSTLPDVGRGTSAKSPVSLDESRLLVLGASSSMELATTYANMVGTPAGLLGAVAFPCAQPGIAGDRVWFAYGEELPRGRPSHTSIIRRQSYH